MLTPDIPLRGAFFGALFATLFAALCAAALMGLVIFFAMPSHANSMDYHCSAPWWHGTPPHRLAPSLQQMFFFDTNGG